jgi:hypothetical protein
MRWNDLFDDLESRSEAADAEAFRADVEQLELAEKASITLAARAAQRLGQRVQLTVADGERIDGILERVSEQWLLVAGAVVPSSAIVAMHGVGRDSVPDALGARGLSLGYALRGVAEQGGVVVVGTLAREYRGVVTLVGRDHLDLRTTPGDHVTIPFAAVMVVRPVMGG